MKLFPPHFRDYPYRPPLHRPKEEIRDCSLYMRFIRTYAWPKRWALLVCMLIVAVNSSSVYLISYFSKMVIDTILVIQTQEQSGGHTGKYRITEPDLNNLRPPSRPTVSMGRNMDMGEKSSRFPPEAGRRLFLIALLYIGSQILFNILSRFATRKHIEVSQGIMSSLREDMHRKVMELSLSYHQAMSPGRLLSRILSDVQSVQQEMMALFINGVHCASMITVGTLILLCVDWRMAAIAAVVVPIYAIMYNKKRPTIRALNQEQRHTNACMYGLVSQKIDAIKAIQSYAREKGELVSFHRLVSSFFRDALRVQWIASLLNCKAGILAHLGNCAIFLYGGKLVLDGEMSLGKMIFLHSSAVSLFQPVLQCSNLSFVLQRLRIALLRVASVLDQKPEIYEEKNAVPFPRPIHFGIEVRNLEFTYPVNKFSKEPGVREEESQLPVKEAVPVIRDVSFTVPAGTWLCIMGASGSGKTTLLHLLSRLYEPQKGEIIIDGMNLKNIQFSSLRQAMGVVPQEAQIFSGTMRDNICYGYPDASIPEIVAAAQAAQMHDFILEMPVQYETLLGQKGTSLSGGQRQRLSLARALLTKPELLILDDCTSALDANTERKVQETLSKTLKGKTAIMVSQRVSMAMRCHKICVLDNGRITEFGSHQELLAKHGFYAKLFSEQTE
ncbi:MAG: ABC transporter ATP-binding protein [Lentisphaeria bacterium]